jgi:serine O-acetyltransferase
VTRTPGAGSFGNPPGCSLVGLWREDLAAHDGDWFAPGFRALAVHRFGNWRMGVRSRALRGPLSVVYRWMERRIVRRYGIELPYSTRVGRRVVIDHQNGIVVHGAVTIGDECRLRQNVTIGARRLERVADAPVLGRGVDVGAGAAILGGITIGDGATIGANAVVLADVPAGALAVGVPARVVRS